MADEMGEEGGRIKVTDPVKHGEGVNAYMSYRVVSTVRQALASCQYPESPRASLSKGNGFLSSLSRDWFRGHRGAALWEARAAGRAILPELERI